MGDARMWWMTANGTIDAEVERVAAIESVEPAESAPAANAAAHAVN
jgi:hypothetical protein